MKAKMRDWLKRKTATALMVAALTEAALSGAYAAEPTVTIDETVYGNLDPYGRLKAVNVVKGVTTNGVKQFQDFGDYTKVTNMSSHEEPTISGDQVSWNLSDLGNRFYYQGTMDASRVELPWTFDVSYKLNGREAKSEELAGAKGLVEIHVKAEPNEKANLYYQNNMMLSVMIPADMSKCYSVDAPGSQTQTVGETTGVVFTALPGEEGDFTARIGSDSYESIGVIIMMIPGTTDSLNHIKDIKEAKDTWRSAGTSLYDSTDAMLATVETMKSGVQAVQSGLTSLEKARAGANANRGAIENQNDVTIASLMDLANQSEAMVPYIQTAKDSADALNTSINDFMVTLNKLQVPLKDLDDNLDVVQDGVSNTADELEPVQDALTEVLTLDTQLQAQEATILMTLVGLSQTGMENDISGDVSGDAESFADDYALAYSRQQAAAMGLTPDDPTYEAVTQQIYEGAYAQALKGYKTGALNKLHTITDSVESPKTNLLKKVDALEQLASSSNYLCNSARKILNGTDKSIDTVRDFLAYSGELIDRVQGMKDTMDTYYPELQNALTDCQTLANNANNAMNQTIASMTIIQNTMKSVSGNLDEGTRKTLDGSMNILDKTLNTIDSTGEIRKSSGVMKTTLDEQLDKFENENRFLEMDPEAPIVSFTSEKNAEPGSLQIILRTDEISIDDDDNGIVDAETAAPVTNPFARMWNVLVKMWNAVKDIFVNR